MNIVGAATIAAAVGSSMALIAGVCTATQRAAESGAAVVFWMSKAPTVSALARWRDIRPDGEHDAPNVDLSRQIVAFERDPCNVGGVFLATSGRQGITADGDSVILAE